MAVYEYKCASCNESITITRGISESDPGYECESCKLPLTRIYSNSIGITFKGSGFYRTDK